LRQSDYHAHCFGFARMQRCRLGILSGWKSEIAAGRNLD
jgi:hypothetical protein